MARNFRRKQDEETTYWLSYSDMMAGLLLTFVLVIALTVLHANIQFDMKQQELLGKEKELFIQADALLTEHGQSPAFRSASRSVPSSSSPGMSPAA